VSGGFFIKFLSG